MPFSLRGQTTRVGHRAPATPRANRRSPIELERLEGRELLSSLKQDILQLGHDLSGVRQGSNVSVAEVQAVAADFKAVGQVATKPDPTTVAALKAEVRIIVAAGPITPAEAVVLRKDLAAVLTSANVPIALAAQTSSDIQAVVTASGMTKADLKTILGDIQAIATDLGSLRK